MAVSDAAGQAVSRVQYDPYGKVLTSTLPVTLTERLFTGARFDGTIGLYQMGARWYDPALGRWIQADTIVPQPGNPQALNRYAYVYNNPLRYTDPTGYFTEEELLAWGITQEQIDEWKSDPAWWTIIEEAQLFDEVRASRRYIGIGPRQWVGEFRLREGELVLFDWGDFEAWGPEYFHVHTKDQELWRLSSGEWQLVPTPTEFILPYEAPPPQPPRYRIKCDPARVDWVGATLDVGGIVADVFTLGIAGRLGNAAKFAKTQGGLVGTSIDLVDLADGGVQFAAQAKTGEVSWVDGSGLVTDVAGLFIPIGPDVAGLLLNFSNACYQSP